MSTHTFIAKHLPSDATKPELWGSFNNWKSGYAMSREGGKHQVTINVSPGQHEFKFKVNGQWVESMDEAYTRVNNGQNSENYTVLVG